MCNKLCRYVGPAHCGAAKELRGKKQKVSLHACKRISSEALQCLEDGNTMKRARAGEDDPAPCITCRPHWDSLSGGDMHFSENRYYTVRELMRLQGMPDAFTLVGSLDDAYMLVGNAVPVPLAHQVAVSCRTSVLK